MKRSPYPLQLTIYLIPIVGLIPSLWTLSGQNQSSDKRAVSRLSVTLTVSWLMAYSVLSLGETLMPSTLWSMRLLYLNGILTTGYFLIDLILVFRLWQGKSPKIPGLSGLANQVFRSKF